MSKIEPEQEARKVAQAIANEIKKIHGRPRNPDAEAGGLKVSQRV